MAFRLPSAVAVLLSSSYDRPEDKVNGVQDLVSLLIPDGHPLVSSWFALRWDSVLTVCIAYPLVLGQLRDLKLSLPKGFTSDNLRPYATGVTVSSYLYVLFEIWRYLWRQGYATCHMPGARLSANDEGIAEVLWFFHVVRFSSDAVATALASLGRPAGASESEGSEHLGDDVRLTLSHFVLWWLVLFYHPGGEVVFPAATVCVVYLFNVAFSYTPGRYVSAKTFLWVSLVLWNIGRLASDVISGCPFPVALLAVSPPYDVSPTIHTLMFCFVSWFPIGVVHYIAFARGALCSCTSMIVFMLCGLCGRPDRWPADDQLPLEPWERSTTRYPAPATLAAMFHEDEHTRKDKRLAAGLRRCAYAGCHRCETFAAEFSVCARCRTAYCCKACQQRDWQIGHRFSCGSRYCCPA